MQTAICSLNVFHFLSTCTQIPRNGSVMDINLASFRPRWLESPPTWFKSWTGESLTQHLKISHWSSLGEWYVLYSVILLKHLGFIYTHNFTTLNLSGVIIAPSCRSIQARHSLPYPQSEYRDGTDKATVLLILRTIPWSGTAPCLLHSECPGWLQPSGWELKDQSGPGGACGSSTLLSLVCGLTWPIAWGWNRKILRTIPLNILVCLRAWHLPLSLPETPSRDHVCCSQWFAPEPPMVPGTYKILVLVPHCLIQPGPEQVI